MLPATRAACAACAVCAACSHHRHCLVHRTELTMRPDSPQQNWRRRFWRAATDTRASWQNDTSHRDCAVGLNHDCKAAFRMGLGSGYLFIFFYYQTVFIALFSFFFMSYFFPFFPPLLPAILFFSADLFLNCLFFFYSLEITWSFFLGSPAYVCKQKI